MSSASGKFARWIDESGGASVVAKRLNVTRHAVNSWLRREATPNTHHAVRLVQWGAGSFTHDDIVKDTHKRVRASTPTKSRG